SATVRLRKGETQKDSFALHVLPRPTWLAGGLKIALFDPKGETGKLLARLGVEFQSVDANADLSGHEVLSVGKGALTPDGPGACGTDASRAWRCGCRANVAPVLIEKPARGECLPVLDGGYALQDSPLLEYREGKGVVLFCQADVTGRTESDPVSDALARNILRY